MMDGALNDNLALRGGEERSATHQDALRALGDRLPHCGVCRFRPGHVHIGEIEAEPLRGLLFGRRE